MFNSSLLNQLITGPILDQKCRLLQLLLSDYKNVGSVSAHAVMFLPIRREIQNRPPPHASPHFFYIWVAVLTRYCAFIEQGQYR